MYGAVRKPQKDMAYVAPFYHFHLLVSSIHMCFLSAYFFKYLPNHLDNFC